MHGLETQAQRGRNRLRSLGILFNRQKHVDELQGGFEVVARESVTRGVNRARLKMLFGLRVSPSCLFELAFDFLFSFRKRGTRVLIKQTDEALFVFGEVQKLHG